MKIHLKKSPRGFTLVELLVAMAITTIIVTILISITAISLDTWNRSRAEIRAARQAQAMTEIMARDFEAMVMRTGNNFEWFSAEVSASVGPANNESPNSADLIFFTAATDRYEGAVGSATDAGGDISAVGYSLRYKDPIDTGTTQFPTFVLYRKLVNPDDTFRDLLGQEDLKAAFTPYQMQLDQMANFVCENIYQFTVGVELVNLSIQEGRRPPEPYPGTVRVSLAGQSTTISQFGDSLESNLPPNSLPNNVSVGQGTRIAAIEISITVISDSALNAIRSASTVSDDFISKNSFQYSKRIEIPHM